MSIAFTRMFELETPDISVGIRGGYWYQNVNTLDAFPNPFNESTNVNYNLAESQNIRIQVLDLNGRIVKTLVNGTQTKGSHTIVWDGRSTQGNEVATGIYVVTVLGTKTTGTAKVYFDNKN